MIAKLSGILDSVSQDSLILDVNGVGYHVFASARTLGNCGAKGAPLALLIDTHVREDHIHLFGFLESAEQQWFRLLISVQGVGAKVALGILGQCPPERLSLAIAAQDKAVLTQADGVGPKLAVRILTELKDKAAKIALDQPPARGAGAPAPGDVPAVALPAGQGDQGALESLEQDALSALVNLGYGRADSYSAIMEARRKAGTTVGDRANDDENLQSLEKMITLALKELSL